MSLMCIVFTKSMLKTRHIVTRRSAQPGSDGPGFCSLIFLFSSHFICWLWPSPHLCLLYLARSAVTLCSGHLDVMLCDVTFHLPLSFLAFSRAPELRRQASRIHAAGLEVWWNYWIHVSRAKQPASLSSFQLFLCSFAAGLSWARGAWFVYLVGIKVKAFLRLCPSYTEPLHISNILLIWDWNTACEHRNLNKVTNCCLTLNNTFLTGWMHVKLFKFF